MHFKLWHQYFLSNQDHFDHIDWSDDRKLIEEERETICSSIRQFQRGEYSEGKHFRQFAETMKDDNYTRIVNLFIREEQEHSWVLGEFMDKQGIERLKKHWLDDMFRWLRKLAGLEGIVTVLLTAEIISMVYYKALRRATGSVLLQTICKQVLKDEAMHLRFQSYSLGVLYKRKSKISVLFSGWLHRLLLAGTILMVWTNHKKVVGSGGYHFFSFYRDVWKEFRKCRRMMKGKASCIPIFYPVKKGSGVELDPV